jgi:hypothetical protein
MVAYTASWWDFTKLPSEDFLSMLGTDPKAADFDPQSNSNDFSIAGVVSFDDTAHGVRNGIMGKWNTGGSWRCWTFYKYGALLYAGTSQSGSGGYLQNISGISPDTQHFVGFAYEYSGSPGNTSTGKIYLDSNSNTATAHWGPIRSTTSADVKIADYDEQGVGSCSLDGSMFWLGFWNRVLAPSEFDDLRTGAVLPCDSPGIVMLIDFHQDVDTTYDTEYPYDTDYTFTVNGTPVHGGSSEAACSTALEADGGLPFKFKVTDQTRISKGLSEGDLGKLQEGLGIEREEPEQIDIRYPELPEQEPEVAPEDQLAEQKTKFEEWLKAAEEMKIALGEKLKDRTVKVDPETNPALRDSIRRVFNKDTTTITYDMFEQALNMRSAILLGEEEE